MKFFYKKEWLEKYNSKITLKIENLSIDEALKQVLNETNLNFYISNKQIILTENSIIYDKVVDNFLKSEDKPINK